MDAGNKAEKTENDVLNVLKDYQENSKVKEALELIETRLVDVARRYIRRVYSNFDEAFLETAILNAAAKMLTVLETIEKPERWFCVVVHNNYRSLLEKQNKSPELYGDQCEVFVERAENTENAMKARNTLASFVHRVIKRKEFSRRQRKILRVDLASNGDPPSNKKLGEMLNTTDRTVAVERVRSRKKFKKVVESSEKLSKELNTILRGDSCEE